MPLGDDSANAAELVELALETTESANHELRELARGIHPAILTQGGLEPALKTIARRSPIPVELELRIDARLPEPTEVTAYFVISEALTNAAKHSNASAVHVTVETIEDDLQLAIGDDGVGGADPARGSGLVGLKDRVEAAGGTLTVHSHIGAGTHLTVTLPVASALEAEGTGRLRGCRRTCPRSNCSISTGPATARFCRSRCSTPRRIFARATRP